MEAIAAALFTAAVFLGWQYGESMAVRVLDWVLKRTKCNMRRNPLTGRWEIKQMRARYPR